MSELPQYERAMCDTNVLAHAFAPGRSEKQQTARAILAAAEAGELLLLVPTITLVELWKVPDDDLPLDRLAVMNAVLEQTNALTYVDLDRPTALLGRELALKHDIRNPYDAAILACAVLSNAEVLLTWDANDFDLGSVYGSVLVTEPYWYGDIPMFDP